MKELLLKRKKSLLLYLLATFMFIVEFFANMGIFALILGAVYKGDLGFYKIVFFIIVLFVVYTGVNFILSRLLRIKYMRDTILDVRKGAFQRIIQMSFKTFSKKSREVYISNLVNDVNTFENKFFVNFLNFMIQVGMYAIGTIILFIMDYKLALGMFVAAAILFLVSKFFSKKTVEYQEAVSESNERFTTKMGNIFQGIEILKLNNIENKFLSQGLVSTRDLETSKYKLNVYTELQWKIIGILSYVIIVCVMIYLSLTITKGVSVTQASFMFQLCSPMGFRIAQAFSNWNAMKASAAIYDKITKKEEEEVEDVAGEKEFQLNDRITVRDLSFAYENKKILDHANFTIEKGRKYLIKGVSGAGKSTLMNLLAKIHDDYSGEILLDDTNLLEVSEDSFHQKVSFIYQDVFLFEDTIENNITLYKDIPQENINFAAEVCGLNQMIQDKKLGMKEHLAENGKNLSGGQRQRISIARAIAKDAEILFVDEGTSSLNEDLGREIEKVFLDLNRTIIAISHRYYEGITNQYDYVLELKNGKVYTYKASEYFGEVVTC